VTCPKVERKAFPERNTKAERREQRELELASKQTALPSQRYGVIVADPEWHFERDDAGPASCCKRLSRPLAPT
jgi:hypothetical protein